MTPIPVVFEPIFKTRPWGGRRLAALLGKQLPPSGPIGESWELVDLPGEQSRVRGGPLAGAGLRELVERWGAGLLGRAPRAAGGFPLLIKFLDAAEDLSVQVHPKPVKGEVETPGVKHEAWYVIHAEPGARILAGARAGATRADFERAAGRAESAELLRSWPVQAGDCFYLPSGTPHALGAGVVVAEVQTPSDVTYRLYDWGRLDTDGRPRALHLEAGLANLRLDVAVQEMAQPAQPAATGAISLCRCERFAIERVQLAAGSRRGFATVEPLVWIVLRGEGELLGGDGELRFGVGDVVLIPAAYDGLDAAAGTEVDLLEVTLPGAAGN